MFPDFQSDSLPTPHSLFCSLVTGDNLASSWAVIMSMGEDGYMKVVKTSHGGHKEDEGEREHSRGEAVKEYDNESL